MSSSGRLDLHELRSGTLLQSGGGGVTLDAAASAYFAEVVRVLFSRWAALRLAVEHQWGGRESPAKAAAAAEDVVSRFLHAKGCVHADEVEDFLDDLMIEQFNTEVEDGSTRLMAEEMVRMFQVIARGDRPAADAWMAKMGGVRLANAVQEPGQDDESDDNDGNDDDDDDDMDAEDEEVDEEAVRQAAALEEEERRRKAAMEEDGFTVVQGRGRRGKKQ